MCTAAVSLQKAGRPCGVADKIADCTTRGVWPLFNCSGIKKFNKLKTRPWGRKLPAGFAKKRFWGKINLKNTFYNTFILYSAVVVGCKLLLVAGGHCRIFVALANVLDELGETQTCFWAPNF